MFIGIVCNLLPHVPPTLLNSSIRIMPIDSPKPALLFFWSVSALRLKRRLHYQLRFFFCDPRWLRNESSLGIFIELLSHCLFVYYSFVLYFQEAKKLLLLSLVSHSFYFLLLKQYPPNLSSFQLSPHRLFLPPPKISDSGFPNRTPTSHRIRVPVFAMLLSFIWLMSGSGRSPLVNSVPLVQ